MKRMKNIFALIVLLVSLSACTSIENRIIETRVNGNSIEWKYESEDSWNHLLNLEDISHENQSDFNYWINESGNLEIQMNDEIFEFPSKENIDLSFIKNIYIDEQYNLIYEYQDGTHGSINLSFTMDDNESTLSLSINEFGELIVTYDNGTTENLGLIKGDDGQDGEQGIQGEAGKDGQAGPQGPSGSTGLQGPIGPAGPAGQDGFQGLKGDRGEQGYSIYDLYLQIHPNYLKSETEWLDDYILGRLSLSDEFDVFDSSDFELGLFLGFNKFRLQQDLILPVDFIFTNHMNINLNGYSIEGDIKVETIDEGAFYIQHGMIIGNLIFSEVDDFIIDALVFGNIETYQVDSIGEITNTVDGFLSIFGDLNLKIENNYSLIINSYGQGVVTLDGTIDQLHINNSQLLVMEPFSMITHIEIHSNHELEITRNHTSVIGSINLINQVIFTGEEVSTEDPIILAPEGYIIGLDMNLEFEISMGRYSEITAVMIEGQSIDESYYSYFNGILSIESSYLDLLELEVMFIDVVLDADYSLQSIIPTYHLMPNIESLMNGYEGINVSVSGVVTKILNHQLMFIEDESGVISIYGDIDGINVGDYIQVVGLKNIYNGLHQITNASIFEIISHNHVISDSIDYQYGMTLIPGMRLNFMDVMISDLYEDLYGNMIFYIYDELNDIYYQAILDSRSENYESIKDVILSLDGQVVDFQNMILSFNQKDVFYVTSLDELIQ